MTAPPVQESQGSEQFDGLDPFERTIQSTLHESKELIGEEQTADAKPRDEQGRFVGKPEAKPDGEWHVLPDAPIGEQQQAVAGAEGEAPQEVAIPEGYIAAPALAPEKVQGFKVLDAEGEIVPPDLTFEVNFRGPNGEVQPRTLDLPKLVNYARMGVYNHEREQESVNVRQYNQALQGRVQAVEQQAQQLHQERERLLSDPDYLLRQLQEYEQQNTPEARAQRARDELQLANQRTEFIQVAQIGAQFVDGEIAPAIDTILKSLPLISQEEVAARITLLIDPYKVRTPFGVTIRPQDYDAIRRAIVQEVVPWAQQVHQDREERQGTAGAAPKAGPKDKTDPAKKDEVATLQTRAQKARRVAATALKPVGGNGAVQGKQDKPIRTSRDLEDAIVGRSIASMRSG